MNTGEILMAGLGILVMLIVLVVLIWALVQASLDAKHRRKLQLMEAERIYKETTD